MSLFTTSVQHCLEGSRQLTSQEKDINIGKEKIKVSFFIFDITVYVENLIESKVNFRIYK